MAQRSQGSQTARRRDADVLISFRAQCVRMPSHILLRILGVYEELKDHDDDNGNRDVPLQP